MAVTLVCALGSLMPNLFCDQPEPETCSAIKQHALLEAKAGYFFFTSHEMRRVYDQGGLDLQLSGSIPIYKFLHVYGSVEYWQKSGHSLNSHERTSIWAFPLSLGLRPVFPVTKHIAYYFTFGPRYFFVRVHNHSSYVPRRMHANGCGLFTNTGFLFLLGEHCTVDLFGEYAYKKLSFHSHLAGTESGRVQVSGFSFGGGLGYSF